MDLYSVLWIDRSASKDEIKKAYRKKAMKYHPDRNAGDKWAEEKFKEINEAYWVLSDDAKKNQYDRFGSTSGAAGWWNPFWGWFSWGWADVDLWDIFESFFWGGFWGWGNTRKRRSEFPGEDLEYKININLKTSIFWGKETIKFNKKESCSTCNWEWWSGKKTCGNWVGRRCLAKSLSGVKFPGNRFCDYG